MFSQRSTPAFISYTFSLYVLGIRSSTVKQGHKEIEKSRETGTEVKKEKEVVMWCFLD